VNVAAAVLVPLSLVVLAILGYWFYKKCYRRQNRYIESLPGTETCRLVIYRLLILTIKTDSTLTTAACSCPFLFSRFDYKYSMLAQEHEYSRKDLLTLVRCLLPVILQHLIQTIVFRMMTTTMTTMTNII
jgi:hypothetical protein